MSLQARPSTPTAQTSPSAVSTPVTGTWRHPKMDEIVKRRNASNFSDRNMKMILYNLVCLIMVFYVASKLKEIGFNGRYIRYGVWLIEFGLVYNIAIACLPLLRPQDDVSDIPLTPAQRKLLGLPPSSAPPTPGSQYVTPPRYARTPSSGSPINRETQSRSPSQSKGSPISGGFGGMGGSFSPSASPLLQKAMGAGFDSGNRRHSYGSPSPLGPAFARMAVPETPGTPTPAAAKGSNLALNSKWLYDKTRRNSGSARLYT
jgi:nucleoporin POM34